MKFRIGLATLGAIALIAILMTGGHVNAQAALMKMRRAVTQVTSSHLHIELAKDIDMGDVSSDDKSDASDAKDGNSLDMLAMGLGAGIAQGNRSIDVWSQGNKWKADVFGKFDALYADGFVTLMMGDKVFMKVKAEDKDIPTNLSDQLFKEFSKATMEMKQKCNVRDIGDSIENGRNLHQLEVTGLADQGKTWRLEYWVDTDTNLPARFQVFAVHEGSPSPKLVANITCDFNEHYPDSLFDPGVDKP